MNDEDDFFCPEDEAKVNETLPARATWPVLIVDDETAVHDVTRLALSDFSYAGKGLHLYHAYSGQQAKTLLNQQPEIALVLLDVVMEHEHAGLEVVDYIRNELHNPFTRIVLRTGQPGTVPERDVILNYDINDYKEKTELTAEKLFTVLVSALRTYQDFSHINRMRYGLSQISHINHALLQIGTVADLADYLLALLGSLLSADFSAKIVIDGVLLAQQGDNTDEPMPLQAQEPIYSRQQAHLQLANEHLSYIVVHQSQGFDEAERQLLAIFHANIRAVLPCWQQKIT